MKLYRGVLALVMMVGATATTGCKLGDLGNGQGDAPDPGDPTAQGPSDGPRNGGGDDGRGMRRARRHRGQGHRGRWNGRPRQGRGQGNPGPRDGQDNPGPQGSGPEQSDE
jgi:hypothetical protein